MKVYRLFHISNGYNAINIIDSELERQLSTCTKDIDFSLFEGAKFKWALKNGTMSDAPFIDGCIPVISDKAYTCLSNYLNGNAKKAKIFIGGEPFNILYGEKILSGVLNVDKSNIRYFRDGRIMQIKQYVFNSNQFPPIFKIAEDPTFDFVSEEIISAINASGLTGFNWEECVLV